MRGPRVSHAGLGPPLLRNFSSANIQSIVVYLGIRVGPLSVIEREGFALGNGKKNGRIIFFLKVLMFDGRRIDHCKVGGPRVE